MARSAIVLSASLPSVCDERWRDRDAFQSLYLELAGRNAPTLVVFFGTVDEQFKEFAPLLKVAAPGPSLVDSLFCDTESAELAVAGQ